MIEPVKIQIRFSDIDVMGHVNNATYLSYFEYTRMYYFEKLLGLEWNWNEHGILLVRNEVEYLKPIFLNDQPIIEMFIGQIGNKSFTFHYEVRVRDVIYTKALSKLVCYNAREKKTILIPELMKKSFSQLNNYKY
ncbi:MAG: acyl-CoA thioesterase [Crocinitomicaceae bacterium]|jgi:acyl-CoA thioester hydrolase|tara:strand:+ start:1735 stop:2139 length:405 start_codon:yes stop_codon:yes gene_type:complete